ncbi:MAG: hypothetical protein M0Z85_09760 [Gammaproteobacteria bacterium]|nr:hypothetical protein [Gammaproteobacteria bacterium]
MKADWVEAFGVWCSSIVALYIALNGYKRERAERERQEAKWEQRRHEEEAERRRIDSILGVAIIGPLLEEVRSGHEIMERALKYIKARNRAATELSRRIYGLESSTESTEDHWEAEPVETSCTNWQQLLPNVSWEGMQTIPDSVLLRIIATDTEPVADEFPVRDIRLHCKNYFRHICENVNAIIKTLSSGRAPFADEEAFRLLLDSGDGSGDYIDATRKVIRMLELALDRLGRNAAEKFPK